MLPLISLGQQTTGLFQYDWPTDEGFTLWGPIFSHDQHIMNNCGEVVHTWTHDSVGLGNSFYLLEDGNMMRCAKADTATSSPIGAGGGGERIQKVAWDGTVTWDYIYYDMTKRLHHDIEVLPNGNVLAIAWVIMEQPECVQAGRNPGVLDYGNLFTERIIEVQPTGPTTGTIVWQWDLWDHLVQDFDNTKDNYGVVAEHPELLDINWVNTSTNVPGQSDFVHLNAIDYNADLDQIIVSSQIHSEVWIVDHSTTTQEAATHAGGTYGKGGDFLYRWGNPQVYDRGGAEDQRLWRQHDSNWIDEGMLDEGGIMIYNNGLNRPVSMSEVDVITPPQSTPGVYTLATGEAYGPELTTWNYHAPDSISFYSHFISGARRLASGNTIICEGESGHLFEVTYDGDVVWSYVNPVAASGVLSSTDSIPMAGGGAFQGNLVFRANKYPSDFLGFAGHDLSSGVQIEFNPIMADCVLGVEDFDEDAFLIYPNPTLGNITVEGLSGASLQMFDMSGRLIYSRQVYSDNERIELGSFVKGLYFIQFELDGQRISSKLIID
jgi:hypothetical protein